MVLTGSYFHLWYVLYVIYALPAYWLIKKFLSVKIWLPIAALLYGFAALQYGYQDFLPDAVNATMSLVNGFYALTNAQFLLLPMLLTGGFLKRQGVPKLMFSFILLILSFFLLIIEGEVLFAHGHCFVSYVLMILPTAASFFCVLQNLTLRSFLLKQCGELSLLIYCIHPIICFYVNPLTQLSLVAWLITMAISLFCALCFQQLTIKKTSS